MHFYQFFKSLLVGSVLDTDPVGSALNLGHMGDPDPQSEFGSGTVCPNNLYKKQHFPTSLCTP
jgi:hypothetical protein